MKAFLIIILASITFYSCSTDCGDTLGLLDSNDLSWLSYNDGQEIIYKSNTGLYDTAIIKRVLEENLCKSNGYTKCAWGYQSGEEHLSGLHYWNGDLEIYAEHYNINCGTSESHAGIFTNGWSSYTISNQFSNTNPQNNTPLNINAFNYVYVLTQDTSNWLTNTGIWRICYSKALGIIEYDFNKGIQWFRIK